MAGFQRFGTRWASSGQLETPSENNSQLGFAFLGAEAPSVELFNQLFQWNDEKDNYLFTLLNEVVKERTGNELAPTSTVQLANAIKAAATIELFGMTRYATPKETQDMLRGDRAVTPSSLKPLIDALGQAVAGALPSGAVVSFARSSAPPGYLVADGRSLLRADYPQLFAAVGTTFGPGDTPGTTFALPDLRGVFIRGWDNGRGIDLNRGFGTLQTSANAEHAHTLSMSTAGQHSHNVTIAEAGAHSHGVTMFSAGDHSHSASTAAAGSHNHRSRDYGQIGNDTGAFYTRPAGGHGHTAWTDQQGQHVHTMARDVSGASNLYTLYDSANADEGWFDPNGSGMQPAGLHAHNVGIQPAGDHQHIIALTADGQHTHAVSVGAVGGHVHSMAMDAVAHHIHTATMSAAGDHVHTLSMGASGTNESRPTNVALLNCIKT